MKLICTGDWHLGNMFHGIDRLDEHRHFLDWMVEHIEQLRPDALLIAGDVFDSGNPSAASQKAYYGFLARLSSLGHMMKVIVTAGNHDSAQRLEAPRPLLSCLQVEIRGNVRHLWSTDADGTPHRTVDYDDLIIPVDGADGTEAVVLAVPYLRSDVISGESYSEGVGRFMRGLISHARTRYPHRRTVMMAHLYATGAEIAAEDASERIIVGGAEQVTLREMADHPDYLTCGHIHKRQHIRDTDWARYSGSVLPMSFAEKSYTHGVDLVEIGPDGLRDVKQLRYTPQHPLTVIPDDDEPADLTINRLCRLIDERLPPLTAESADENAVYVALRVTHGKISADDIAVAEKHIAERNAILCKIQKIMPPPDIDTECESINPATIDDILNLDPVEVLAKAFALKHGTPLSERQREMLSEITANAKNDTEL